MKSSGPAEEEKFDHGRSGVRRIMYTALYSRDGFIAAFRSEAAFRQLLVLHGALVLAACVLEVSSVERAILLAVCLISLLVELLNSAIEAVVDRISLEIHPLSKRAKDMGSAAQAIALLMVSAVWGVVLFG